ncbi:MAG TPA: glycosyltransferase family 4 protein [Planctomycetota bacterium]|nr:glycosyltransferase family 4 protein [Planctomycetota bacterium]
MTRGGGEAMKVLHLFSNWRWTGPAEPALNLAAALRQHGHEVTLACGRAPHGLANALEAKARERGVPLRTGLALNKHMNPFHNYPDGRTLRGWLEAEPFDLIHCHLRNDHVVAALAARRMPGRPLVVRSCYLGDGPRGYWEGRLAREFTEGMLLLSESARRQAVERLRLPADRAWLFDTAVDLGRFNPDRGLGHRRAELGFTPDTFVIGVVARVQWRRRYHVLLEAIARACRELPNLRALLVGRGTHMKAIAVDPARKMGLSDVVLFPGYQTGDDYVRILATLDAKVFLVPGTDGSCRAVREAMAMGVPVISSRRGMLPELVADGDRGVLVDDTPEELAGAIVALARDPERRQALGRRARQYALEHFSLERQAEVVGGVYAELLERHRKV